MTDRFPPHVLREYALVADGQRAALIGPRGDVAWLCVPDWHSGSVFSTLIGGEGVYAMTPDERFVWGGYYEDGSLIWRSRWVTNSSIVESREALAYPSDPTSSPSPRAVFLRRLTVEKAAARMRVVLEPRAGYGSEPFTAIQSHDGGVWTGKTGDLHVRWQAGAVPVTVARRGRRRWLEAVFEIEPGRHYDFVLEFSVEPLGDAVMAEQAWTATESAWAAAVPRLDNTLAPRNCRSTYAVMRGLTSPGGGMVAAATTSLPERAEQGRNYDYRYVWIRDQSYAGHAAAAIGDDVLLAAAARFVSARLLADGPRMAPAYTITGEPVPDQYDLGLAGYPGGSDRIGNWVNHQFQLDAFGEALIVLVEAERAGVLDRDGWDAVEVAASAITSRWQEPDAGIWEIDNRPWTHSRLMAVAGLRSAAAVAPGGAPDWLALADKILADTAATSLHRDGHWIRSPGDDGLDGALLIPPLRGAVPSGDPRSAATLDAYLNTLTQDGYAYRFRQGPGPLGDGEGSFSLCGFYTSLALADQGRDIEAVRWWERITAATGPPMLYSEEFDVDQHQLRGNLPQAFVHALMLESGACLARRVA